MPASARPSGSGTTVALLTMFAVLAGAAPFGIVTGRSAFPRVALELHARERAVATKED